ncbi:MAG: hypothetical protein K2G47_00105 [Muribaculum sp.]|nr:hypothetical protein [Muribaculum sp.]
MANNIYHIAAAIISLGLPATAAADDLTKEITVEKDIVVQEREAQKLSQLPVFNMPSIENKKLSWTDRAIAAPLTHDITRLAPAPYAASIEKSPYRGYIDAGYFPSFELGVSAGYRIIDNDATRLGAWLQYDGSNYKRNNREGDKLHINDHTATIGAGLRHSIEDAGVLEARLAYSLSAFNFPNIGSDGISQTANTLQAGIGWSGAAGSFLYNAAVDYGFFNFTDGHDSGMGATRLKPLTENHANIALGGSYGFDDNNFVGADVAMAFAGATNTMKVVSTESLFSPEMRGNYNHGYVAVTPYYRHSGSSYSIKLGLQLYDTWGGDNGFRIAPDIRADWHSGDKFAIYARFTGGNPSLNAMSSLFAVNHYINPSLAYGDSWQKWNVDAGFIIGPFSGASIEAWGGTGKAKNLLMPTLYSNFDSLDGLYCAINYTNLHYGVALNYQYRDIATLRIAYEGAPQQYDKGNAMWLDRAKNVFDAKLTVTPIEALDLSLGYELRSGRATYEVSPAGLGHAQFSDNLYVQRVTLGNVSNLHFEAAYKITPAFSVGAQLDNLLNSKWDTFYGIPAKGISGLVGIGYKF